MKTFSSVFCLVFLMISSECLSKSRSCPICPAEKDGDVVHRGSKMFENFPGHAGVFLDGSYLHVTPDFDKDEAALRSTSLDGFLAGNKFWGAKRHKSTPKGLSTSQVDIIRKRIGTIREFGVVYDTLHLNQKGIFKSVDFSTDKMIGNSGYYQFDCVGFTEHIYENIRNHPTSHLV